MKLPSHSRSQPLALIVRTASVAALLQIASAVPTTSYNTGTLGVAGDGASTTDVLIDQPGAVAAYNDYSSSYAAGQQTLVPFLPQINPAASSPFTIEFWAKPSAWDDDDAPIGNRLGGGGNRSGWVFFQRAAGNGWNFRMYNGTGGGLGWSITGGTATLNAWTHVVVTWNGTAPSLYVNGAFVSTTNDPANNGLYNPNTTENFHIGALIGGASPYTGQLDEIAYYPTALSALQITNHFNTISNPVPGAYSSMVLADGAIEYLQQNPPEAKLTWVAGSPTLTFTGILAQSEDLTVWNDVITTSPYTVPSPVPGKLFFRSHR
jgi:hypothetical protein